MNLNSKIKKISGFTIKLLIIIITYGFIYKHIFYRQSLHEFYLYFIDLFSAFSFLCFFALIFSLMLINWGIESWKWKYLIGKIEKISFFQSYKAVLCGITVSTLLPNRTGDFMGRIFILKKASFWEGIFVTVIGSISQLLITIITGLTGALFFISHYTYLKEYLTGYIYDIIFFIVISLICLLIFLFFNISVLTSLIRRINFLRKKKFRIYARIFSIYSFGELFNVLCLSFIRYCVFAFQYFLLLKLFNIQIPFWHGMMIISLNYLIVTAIPTFALSELGVRGSVAITLFSIYFNQINYLDHQTQIAILAASSLLWLINLAIPALFGSIFVFNLNIFRKKE